MIEFGFRQSYNSLFDRFDKSDFRDAFSSLFYAGTLAEVLDELEIATAATNQQVHLLQLALHPARVIRATIEHKISNPYSPSALLLLRESLQLGLDIYRDPKGSHSGVEQFRQRVIETAADTGLLEKPLEQPDDRVTWRATDPKRSQKTAKELASANKKGDLLFIALAHGGVVAGLDVFLRYTELARTNGSEFYVTRFSRRKLGDELPRLTLEEIRYLQDRAVRKQVVIFDEDVCLGTTLRQAQAYFCGVVFPGQVVKIATNLGEASELANI